VGVGASPTLSQNPHGAVVFTIKCPPSLNVQRKYGIGQKKRFRDSLALEMLACCPKRVTAHERLLLATERPKRIVKFTRFWYVGKVGDKLVNAKEFDKYDNLPGACKPALDELKLITWRGSYLGHKFECPGLGLIFDDNEKYCCALYDQQKSKEKAGQLLIEVLQ
jgi:hypothetical protein